MKKSQKKKQILHEIYVFLELAILYSKLKESYNDQIIDDVKDFFSEIKEILIKVYDDIFPLTWSMNDNKEIILAVTKLVNAIQSICLWIVRKTRSSDTRNAHNGHLFENQTLADVLCVLKCYIDACDFQFDEIFYGEIHGSTNHDRFIPMLSILEKKESTMHFIHYLPNDVYTP